MSRSIEGGHWSIHVKWKDQDAQIRGQSLDCAALLRRAEYLSELASDGLLIMPGAIQQFATYLSLCAARPNLPRFRTYHSLGLHAWSRNGFTKLLHFVLPDRCLKPSREALLEFQREQLGRPLDEQEDSVVSSHDEETSSPEEHEMEEVKYLPHYKNKASVGYQAAGTLDAWQAIIAPFIDNALFVFALSFAFSSLLVGAAGGDIVIAHLYGQSSSGKTAALQAAMSVLGIAGDPQNPSRSNIERWNSTSNGIELLLASHSGMLAAMDELGSSVDAIISVYNATSGQGKIRMNDAGHRKEQLEWRLGILSSGEVSMQEKVEASNKRRSKLGENIRALDIPIASLNQGNTRSTEEQAAMIRNLKRACSVSYGTAGPAFMQAVLDSFVTEDRLQQCLVEKIDSLQIELIAHAARRRRIEPAHAQIGRAHV